MTNPEAQTELKTKRTGIRPFNVLDYDRLDKLRTFLSLEGYEIEQLDIRERSGFNHTDDRPQITLQIKQN